MSKNGNFKLSNDINIVKNINYFDKFDKLNGKLSGIIANAIEDDSYDYEVPNNKRSKNIDY
jgi:hypothetical protein